MRRTVTGWFFAVTGFLACPCHLVVTLPLAAALLSGTALGGTALGGWITTHQGAIAVSASLYFIGGPTIAPALLLSGSGRQAVGHGSSRAGTRIGVGRATGGGNGAPCCPPQRLSHSRTPTGDTSEAGVAGEPESHPSETRPVAIRATDPEQTLVA